MRTAAIIILILISFANTSSALMINEVMPDPAGPDAEGEWIELFNEKESSDNLAFFSLNGLNLPRLEIAPLGIVILARNTASVKARYPGLTAMVMDFKFQLTNSGASLKLRSDSDNSIQDFIYGKAKEAVSYELLRGDCAIIRLNIDGDSIGALNHECTLSPLPDTTPPKSPAQPFPTVKLPSPKKGAVTTAGARKNIYLKPQRYYSVSLF
jgi:hypothetical protein